MSSLLIRFLMVGIRFIQAIVNNFANIKAGQLFKQTYIPASYNYQYQMDSKSQLTSLIIKSRLLEMDKAQVMVGKAYFEALVTELICTITRGGHHDDGSGQNTFINELLSMLECSQWQIYQRVAEIYSTLNCDEIKLLRACMEDVLTKSHLPDTLTTHELTVFQHDSTHQLSQEQQGNTQIDVSIQANPKKQSHKQGIRENKAKDLNLSHCFKVASDQKDLPFILDISQIHFQQEPNPPSQADWIDQYLASVPNYRSQINLLCQQMKIPPVFYERCKQNRKFFVRASIRFFYSANYFQFAGNGCSINYKYGCQQAAYSILKQIYSTLPQIWYSFAHLKTIKGL